jgi:hypothetical protein
VMHPVKIRRIAAASFVLMPDLRGKAARVCRIGAAQIRAAVGKRFVREIAVVL